MTDPDPAPKAVVAIPARNEEARIGKCIQALAEQVGPSGRSSRDFQIVVLINNTSDHTREAAIEAADRYRLNVECIDLTLSGHMATAGWARRAAMDAAADRAGPDGIVLTTDADSRPQPHWLSRNLLYLQSGADAVAGEIDWDPNDPAPPLSANRRLEALYAEQCAQLSAWLDPVPHDPWPNHRWAWGASLAVTVAAYRAVGGLPTVNLAEDRAFQAALLRHDFKIRHAPDVRVWTSGRTSGRAPGGLADLIRTFAADESTLCDSLLEPPQSVFRKASLRGRLRRAWADGDDDNLFRYATRFSKEIRPRLSKTFGDLWETVSASSPRFANERVHPQNLPAFSRRIAQMLSRLSRLHAARRTSRR